MSSNKKYWKSVEELNENSSIVETLQQNEFVEEIPTDEFLGDKEALESSSTSRRDFLKYVGFSTAAASLAACEGPVIKSIPYVVQPTEIVPGVANYYATTIANGFDFASVLVKTREVACKRWWCFCCGEVYSSFQFDMAQGNAGGREWNSGLFGCLSDIKSCVCAYFCMPCTLCKISTRMGEQQCVWCLPGALTAMRTKLRTQNSIEGSVCGDALTIWCCGTCAVCQMEREMDHIGI